MAKKIFASQEEINAFLASAQAQLIAECSSLKSKKFQTDNDRNITLKFSMEESVNHQRAHLKFTPTAWVKMTSLIQTWSDEIEWHGVVERLSETAFLVKDILIFPHKVTGASVVSDQNEYEEWLNALDDDTFNALRFHGHSHVNMGVSPSGVDMEYRKNVLNNFGTPTEDSDYFYIFIISNKRGEISGEIYDLQNNALYGTADIIVEVLLGDDGTLQDFIAEARRVVKQYRPTYTYPYYNEGGYGGYPHQGSSGGTPITTASGKKTEPAKPKPKKSAKSEALQKDLFDIEDDKREEEDLYERYYKGQEQNKKGA